MLTYVYYRVTSIQGLAKVGCVNILKAVPSGSMFSDNQKFKEDGFKIAGRLR